MKMKYKIKRYKDISVVLVRLSKSSRITWLIFYKTCLQCSVHENSDGEYDFTVNTPYMIDDVYCLPSFKSVKLTALNWMLNRIELNNYILDEGNNYSPFVNKQLDEIINALTN